MTKHDPTIDAMLRALDASCEVAERIPNGQRILGEALCIALDTVGAGGPKYEPYGNMREDAAFWADMATPMELEIYAAAALDRIQRATFATRARKRLFNVLWRSFTDAERSAFLAGANGKKPP
jgi:hypothetical protein